MGGDLGLFINPAFPSESCIIPSQLINHGPSSISQGVLELSCPQALEGQQLLYVTRVTGLSNCTSNYTPNSQGLEVRTSTWAWGGGLGPWAGGYWSGDRLHNIWKEEKDPHLLHSCPLA